MSVSSKLSQLSTWAMFLLIGVGFILMIMLMMRDTGDNPFETRVETTVHSAPGSDAPVLETLPEGTALQCHAVVADAPDWLDCSDMIEKRFVRVAHTRPME